MTVEFCSVYKIFIVLYFIGDSSSVFNFSISNSGKAKMIVQHGLEQIRTLNNTGMHPKLVIHLAWNFSQKVEWTSCSIYNCKKKVFKINFSTSLYTLDYFVCRRNVRNLSAFLEILNMLGKIPVNVETRNIGFIFAA